MEAIGDLLDSATALVTVGCRGRLGRGLVHRNRFERARPAALDNSQQDVTPSVSDFDAQERARLRQLPVRVSDFGGRQHMR